MVSAIQERPPIHSPLRPPKCCDTSGTARDHATCARKALPPSGLCPRAIMQITAETRKRVSARQLTRRVLTQPWGRKYQTHVIHERGRASEGPPVCTGGGNGSAISRSDYPCLDTAGPAPARCSRRASSRSDSIIRVTSCLKLVFGFHPSCLSAFDASPRRKSTSVGR